MRADARQNRDAIIAAGRRQISAHGMDFAFGAVASEAGVGIATLYRNFRTREELVAAVLKDQEAHVLAAVRAGTELLESDPEGAWTTFAHTLADLRPGALVSAFASAFVSPDGFSPEISPDRESGLAAAQGFIDAAIAAGLVRPGLTAAQFNADLAVITRPPPNVGVAMDSQVDRLVEIYLRGLRP